MADLTAATRSATVDQTTDLYFVRVDFPVSANEPRTLIEQGPAAMRSDVLNVVEAGIRTHGHWLKDVASIQVRVWKRIEATDPAVLVFDLNAVPPLVMTDLVRFLDEQDHVGIAGHSLEQEAVRTSVGGPFDSEHALIVALNRGPEPG